MITSILFIAGLFIYWLAYGRFKRSKNISGPSITPFFGHYNEFKQLNYQLHLLIDKYYKESDEKVFSFFHYNKEVFVLKDNELIQQILVKQADHFQNRQFFVELPWPCNQMITMIKGGATHKYIRTILSSLTSTASLKNLACHVHKAADTLVNKVDDAAVKNEILDIESHSQGFKAELLTSLAFSINCPNQSDFNKSLVNLMKDFTNPPTWVHQIAALPYGERMVKQFKGAYKNQLQPFIDTALGIVGERRKPEYNHNNEDILQLFLDTQQSNEKGRQLLTDEVILAQGLVLLTAVQAQTSYTLANALYFIAKYQHIQEKIQKEIDLISADDGFPTWDYLNSSSTKYLGNVITESQRLHPSIFMLTRECTKSCKVGGISFVKGDTVVVPTYSIHRDEALWKDYVTFNPDRFEGEQENKNFYPYGIGARMCTGSRLANLEIKVVLAKLLSKYTITLADPKLELKAESNVTIQANMTIKQPIPVIVTKR